MRSQKFSFGRLSSVDLRLLRVFATIVEAGGFTEAMEQLDVAPSTISTDVANLEKRLGLRLCNRGRSGFALTDKGRQVYGETLRLLTAVESFESQVASIKGQTAGELKIGIIDNSVFDPATRMPGTIYQFTDRYPDVHVTVEVMAPQEIEAAVLEGQLHLGIGVFPRRRPLLDYVGTFTEALDLYCGKDHVLFTKPSRSLTREDVAGAHYAKGIYVPTHSQAAPLPGWQPSATTHQAEGLAFLILSGRFIGYLPRRYARIWVERGMMRALMTRTFSRDVDFNIITRKGSEPTPLRHAFLQVITGSDRRKGRPSNY